MTEITGTVERVVFRNEENGFAVTNVRVTGENKKLHAVGVMPDVHAGMLVVLRGEYETHPRFGEQFTVKDYDEAAPTGAESIEAFLASGIVKGIGPKTAALIVARFGDETMDVIGGAPERLLEISGIGEKKLRQIAESYAEHREVAEVVLHFVKLGIGRAAAMRFYKLYGAAAPAAIEEDPYRLVREAEGIDFRTADRIALRMGFAENSEQRIKSGLVYLLSRAALDGNTYLPEDVLLERTEQLLGVMREETEDALLALLLDGALAEAETECGKGWFLDYYFQAEKGVANGLRRLMNADISPVRGDAQAQIGMAERARAIELSGEQREAVDASLSNAVFVLTGGPGTGKTTILKEVADIFAWNGFALALAAPTGRAAKRMAEQTGREAKTIHRLLEYSPAKDAPPEEERFAFGRDAGNPLELDVLIVDEASMIDVLLMDALLDAMPSGARLILVGDADQLPPVGPGNVLKDILASERVEYAALTEIYRQAAESLIVTNAHRIDRGERPHVNDKEGNFFFYRKPDEAACLQTIIELCGRRLPEYMGYTEPRDILSGIQVITPVKQRLLGTQSLNAALQQALNPPVPGRRERVFGHRVFREGDKVMQMKNDYSLTWIGLDDFEKGEGVFNGDIGFVENVDEEEGTVSVVFDGGRLVKYDTDGLENIELAYAITVHKSQGSEYPVVVMPMMFVPPMLATRNLLYTAVTRGRDLVVLVGSEERMMAMIENAGSRDRYSALAAFLRS
ncbi:MAG: ATP-dependent RecD-like DNA helicase [Clostridiales Family XIII bacterium]|nr:ATP-dependent RecD-like DNA helicase [Clostridiales Family XIII bacterium]